MVTLIMCTIVWSSSVASASHGGGVGAGAGVRGGAGTAATRTGITVTAIPIMATAPVMVMATAGTDMARVNLAMVNMAIRANPESRSCNAGCSALVITMDPLTES